ncbi:serine O-acetyltransferase [Psychromonas sp. Urea-02u-13]|uniref:serine O-acetyltransferase n=1 Tax=Psychromonas sp. Urea-02u-13 TaxID=2058326 RepID=UPI000C31D734|nr:serine acetyltransferase [Psychromonas sp. Urea-02u-13]PKG37529.1 serine acetyltransferase [Psychromonas sp. Urea-02u-13]
MRLYKLGNFFYRNNIPLLPKLCNLLIRLIHNCAVYSETRIGAKTIFGYGGIGVVIHKRTVIGTNCTIGTNVTIGGKSGSKNVPVIGNDVFIATGAKILGDLKVGNNCVIGANAVVIKDVPDNCVVAGIPAKIIKSGINVSDFK